MQIHQKPSTPNKRLVHQRELRGWSQQKLADEIGTTSKIVGRWERGESTPNPYYREKLCALFECNAQELGFLDMMQEVGETSPHPRTGGNELPHLEPLYGRDQELEALELLIGERDISLIALVGLGGIGKTSLATALAYRVKDQFDCIFWRSLQNAPRIADLLQECIQQVSGLQQIDFPENLDDLLTILLSYLRKHRCLLILDNIETILQANIQAGRYREGFEGYGNLLRTIGEEEHQSCLLLTGREKPGEIAFLEGVDSPVRSYQLGGLHPEAGQHMLQHKGLYGEEKDWETFVTHYDGNPLSLKLVAQSIRELFDGDIAGFLAEGDLLVSDLTVVLDQQFSRLSVAEQRMMYWLAIEREPTTLKTIQEEMIYPVVIRALQEAGGSLRRRDLIEVKRGRFMLQNVILEYITNRFIDACYDEIMVGAPDLLEQHALMKAQAKDYIRESQLHLILSPLAERLVNSLGREMLEDALKWHLADLRKRSPQQPGYLAANILHLLRELHYDLRGYDFSYTALWQASLQDVELPQVNFTHVEFKRCTFNETFGDVLAVAVHPFEGLIATSTANCEIRVWQGLQGIPLLICRGHSDWVYTVAFSPDGHLLASGCYDCTVRLWDSRTGQALLSLQGHTDGIRAVAFSPDGKWLASGGDDQTIRIWDIQSGQTLNVLSNKNGWIRAVAFSPDGKLLASGNDDHTVSLWNVETGHCVKTLQGHEEGVCATTFSPDGKLLASGGGDQVIRLWDVRTGENLAALRAHAGTIWSLAFSSDGTLLASGSDDQCVRIWDVQSREPLNILQRHRGSVRSVAFSPDSETLISGSSDQSMRIWEVKSGQLLKTLQGYSSVIWSTSWKPDGELVVSSGSNRFVNLWNAETGHLLKTLRGHTCGVWSSAWSPDGKYLASSGDDQCIRLWDVRSGRILKTFYGHGAGVRSIAFSPDGKLLASGSDNRSVRIWDVAMGLTFKQLNGHNRWVRAVTFSPDSKLLATGSGDQTVRLWEVETGQMLAVLEDHESWVRAVAFSPDGKLIASGAGDKKIRLWDVSTGKLLEKLQVDCSGICGIRSLSFSPDRRLLAAGYQDTFLRIWDLSTGQLFKSLLGDAIGGVWDVSFSPDGELLVTGGDDGIIKIWNTSTWECKRTMRCDNPYEGMNITGAQGLTDAQKVAILALGGIEET